MSVPMALAASAGVSALQSNHHAVPNSQGGPITPSEYPRFSQLMQAMQQGGVNLHDLMALTGTKLQNFLKSLTPQQQQQVAQQLYGYQVSAQNQNGSFSSGPVTGIHLEGPEPTVTVGGLNYTLDRLNSIKQAQV